MTVLGETEERPVVRLDAAFKARSHSAYVEMRRQAPVHRVSIFKGVEGWLVTDWDLAKIALTHPDLGKDASPAHATLAAAGYTAHLPDVGLGENMLQSDPPDHTRLRRLVSAAFTRRRVEELRPRIARIADDLIDALPAAGTADLMAAFCGPLPTQVICELLGVPVEDGADFRAWTRRSLGPVGPEQQAAYVQMNGYLTELIERKSRTPGDDLLSALVAVRDENDGRLSANELTGTASLLVVAGHDTTVNLLGNAVVALFDRPDQAAILRARPELMAGAVEEFLRYDTPNEWTPMRYAARDLELGGRLVRRGEIVMVALGSVNRGDPLLPEADREVLDVTRPNARHLAFGHGIHHCLGAPLARLEAEVALGILLRRLPDLRPAVPLAEIPWIPVGIMHGPLSLPVSYTSSPPA